MISLSVKQWWNVLDNGPDDDTAWELYRLANPTLSGMHSQGDAVVVIALPPHLETRARQVMQELGIQEAPNA